MNDKKFLFWLPKEPKPICAVCGQPPTWGERIIVEVPPNSLWSSWIGLPMTYGCNKHTRLGLGARGGLFATYRLHEEYPYEFEKFIHGRFHKDINWQWPVIGRWKVLKKTKVSPFITVSESFFDSDSLNGFYNDWALRRFVAKINGYSNWKLVIGYPKIVKVNMLELAISYAKDVKELIDAGNQDVFYASGAW